MTKTVKIGNKLIGGGNAIALQSMTNVKTANKEAVISQILSLQELSCDIIRVAVKDEEDLQAIKDIKNAISIPLVADIHFDYRLAIGAIERGVDKIRINPGNIGDESRIKMVADALKAHGVACRVGSNSGSIEKKFEQKYGRSEIALAESALEKVAILEKYGFNNIVISAKASSVPLTVKTYQYLSQKTQYPLHLGVTEAGTLKSGLIKGSAGIGALLLNGVGDTIRFSLTDKPEEEVLAGVKLLRALGLGKEGVEIISCPTCGRTEYDSISLANRVEMMTASIKKPLKIAVMGCVVNGPGEAKDCDIGIAGNGKNCVIFKKGEVYLNTSVADAEKVFLEEINKLI
ncbi:MAG: flavodoxin-dependent (E)-4-hydroxy-3-methylbut-2-enyl-diphosphate synthase [Clostridiales bacterium]|nr:flavodoxin-dependent (E)-4-hydroxy-3-methylbut-2-enyl-diphosphate synthase [Clostridiales bacterium]